MGLPQHGGEGKGEYKGNKTNMKLSQHGGEGNKLGTKGTDVDFTPAKKPGDTYTGPGRHLKTESF